MTYVWKYSDVSADAIADETGAPTTAEREITVPGWYQVDAIAALNRETQNKLSKVCRVTNPVSGLDLVYDMDQTPWDYTDVATYKVPTAELGRELTMAVKIDEATPVTALTSDEYTYIWQVQKAEQAEWIVVTEDMPEYVSGLGTAALTIKTNSVPDAYENYRCSVINTLNDKTAEGKARHFFITTPPAIN